MKANRRRLVSLVTALALAAACLMAFSPGATAATWTYTGKPGSDTINSLAYDGARNILYAGTESSGVYRCINPNTAPSWTSITGLMTNHNIESLAYDASRNVLYACGQGSGNDSVWRNNSPDSSAVWTNLTDLTWTAPSTWLTTLTVNQTDDILFAGTNNSGSWKVDDASTVAGTPATAWDQISAFGGSWVNAVGMGNGDSRLYVGLPSTGGAHRCNNPNDPTGPYTVVDMGGTVGSLGVQHFAFDDGTTKSLYASVARLSDWTYYLYRCDNPATPSLPVTWTNLGLPYL